MFELRGVLEGFYGRPWSWAERERMIDFMAEVGLNIYCYAPKNDPIHRGRWREPYLPEEIERFGQLATRCALRGVEFNFGLSPLKMHYSDPADLEILVEKFRRLYEVGVRSFGLLLDDMPDKFNHEDDAARFASIGHGHVWVVNTVVDRLKALGGIDRLIFTPTEYHGTGVSPYLETLGKGLYPDVDLFWTGGEVCSQFLRTPDARVISETLKRPVLYWDNYPVNDLEMHFDPHLRPFRGRDGDLDAACKGIVANGSLQPEAAKIPLYTLSMYMKAPQQYNPDMAWQIALMAITRNPEDAVAVATLGDLSRRSVLDRGQSLANYLVPRLARFWERWGSLPAVAGPDIPDLPPTPPTGAPEDREGAMAELEAEFARLHSIADRLLNKLGNEYLKVELQPWAAKLAGWAEVGTLGLTVLRKATNNPADPELPALRRRTLDAILTTRENFHWVGGDIFDNFARRCLWAAAFRPATEA